MWRKLRRLGVVQLLDGLVALPADARTREQLDWVADEVLEAGGDATVWTGRPGSRSQEQALAKRMADAIAQEYQAVIDEASKSGTVTPRTVSRLRRELHRIGQRDFFPPPEREQARHDVERLAVALVEAKA